MHPFFPSLQPFGSPDLLVSGEVRSFPPSSASSTGFLEVCRVLPHLQVPGARKGLPYAICLLCKADFCGSSGPVWAAGGPQTQLPLRGDGEAHARSQVWPGSWYFFLPFSSASKGQAPGQGLGTLGEILKRLEHFKNRVLGLVLRLS